MTQRRRQTKRKARPWSTAIAVSVGVHIAVIAGLIALGWRAIENSEPGSAISVHIVLDAAGLTDSANSPSLLRATAKPRLAVAGSPNRETANLWDPSPHHPPSSEQPNDGNANTKQTGSAGNTANGNADSGEEAGNSSNAGGAGDPVLAEIRRRIERAKHYPAQARVQHIEGRVGLRFSIQADGQLRDLHVTQSSGSAVLDQAALQAVQHSTPLPHYTQPISLSLAFRIR